LHAQNISENAGDKQKMLNKSEQQIQTGVLARLKGKETSLT